MLSNGVGKSRDNVRLTKSSCVMNQVICLLKRSEVMWKNELKSLVKNKVLFISVIVIACIPTLYSAVFLGSIWDPYSKTEYLRIAVVNEDVKTQFQNKTLEIGNELIDNLKENNSFKWEFVDEAVASEGLQSGKYYMIIKIPENFSENATTVLDETPKQLELTYETNPGHNMLGDLIMKSGATQINENIRKQVTKEYLTTIASQLSDIGDSLNEGSEGATALLEGSEQLLSGNQELSSNLETLVSSTLVFKDGMNQLSEGVSTYLDGVGTLNSGLSDLNKGSSTLLNNVKPLQDGITQLNEGASSLVSGLQTYTDGVSSLNKGTELLAQKNETLTLGMKSLYDGLVNFQDEFTSLPEGMQQLLVGSNEIQSKTSQLKNAIVQLNGGTNELVSGVEKLSESLPSDEQLQTVANLINPEVFNTLTAEQQASVLNQVAQMVNGYTQLKESVDEKLLPGATQVNNGLTELSEQVPILVQGLNQLAAGLTSLSEKLPLVTKGLTELVNGSQTLYQGLLAYTKGVTDLNDGSVKLSAYSTALMTGAKNLENGISSLLSKVPALIAGVTQLNDGALQLWTGSQTLVAKGVDLSNGMQSLVSGSSQLQDGSVLLQDGSKQLGIGLSSLTVGTKELATQLGNGADDIQGLNLKDVNLSMMATPTILLHQEDTTVSNYGNALAPYFLSLSLYVGALVFAVIYPISRCVEVPKSASKWWFSKFVVIVGQAVLQCVVISAIMFGMMHFEISTLWEILLVTFVTSLTYLFMTTLLASAFGNPGRFIAMVILVLQIGSAGGTFPIELTNGFYQFLNPLLPMSYSINGLREGMFGAMGGANYTFNIMLLLCFLVGSMSLLYVVFKVKYLKQNFELELH
ncbi:MAG TPA: hypothetical protein DCY20_01910 [Firmicutes bacterium]|nr:hypothetical protein [Bacillota bacterium]